MLAQLIVYGVLIGLPIVGTARMYATDMRARNIDPWRRTTSKTTTATATTKD